MAWGGVEMWRGGEWGGVEMWHGVTWGGVGRVAWRCGMGGIGGW